MAAYYNLEMNRGECKMESREIDRTLFATENEPIEGTKDASEGSLFVQVRSGMAFLPVKGAKVAIYLTGDMDKVLQEKETDESGELFFEQLAAPKKELSLIPDQSRPYADYTIVITAGEYSKSLVDGIQILAGEMAEQIVLMAPEEVPDTVPTDVVIPDHTLYGDYPAKIPEEEIKPIQDSGEIVLSRVVIPEYVVVHDGVPTDSSAKNYWIKYKDYIKNVASSEIYATWPEATIYANILAIMSFTLNRVYTEWYRNQGYNFTITSSTAYDQKWSYGRNTYQNIDRLVDSVFANYISRPGVKQPLFTSYCDGNKVSCKGLSQWGSKYLGDKGYTAIEILRYYYGNDIYINTASRIAGVPSSYPGYALKKGSSGEKVRQLQNQLNRIAQNYPAIPKITADGVYGSNTEKAVKKYQSIFGLPATGITDYATWYSVSDVYVGVTRIAEPY